MWPLHRAPTIAVVTCLIALVSGCTTRVTLEVLQVRIVEQADRQTATYEKYPDDESGVLPDNGPWLVVLLASESDLEAISRSREMHHLWYSAFQCPRAQPGAFTGGIVFDPLPDEMADVRQTAKHVYKVYVPLDLHDAIQRSAHLHTNEQREIVAAEIRANGLCLWLKAGSMAGFALESNPVELPVDIETDTLSRNRSYRDRL